MSNKSKRTKKINSKLVNTESNINAKSTINKTSLFTKIYDTVIGRYGWILITLILIYELYLSITITNTMVVSNPTILSVLKFFESYIGDIEYARTSPNAPSVQFLLLVYTLSMVVKTFIFCGWIYAHKTTWYRLIIMSPLVNNQLSIADHIANPGPELYEKKTKPRSMLFRFCSSLFFILLSLVWLYISVFLFLNQELSYYILSDENIYPKSATDLALWKGGWLMWRYEAIHNTGISAMISISILIIKDYFVFFYLLFQKFFLKRKHHDNK